METPMPRTTVKFLLPLLFLPPVCGQLPEFYKSVDRLIWVVPDMDATVAGLKKLGFTNLSDQGEVEMPWTAYHARPATGTLRMVSGRFADLAVHWLQPLGGSNAFQDFLNKHGGGVFSLVHRVPTKEVYEDELARLKGLGVAVLQSGFLETDSGNIHYAFLDTEAEGKYVLGLIQFPSGEEGPLYVSPENPSGRRVTQYAFAVRELEPVSAYWARVGFPEMTYTQGPLHDRRYRGQTGQFEMRLGWQRHGKVPYEWILSLKGPDIYLDHVQKHGEGFHHLAFSVEDMDREIAEWTKLGFPEAMSGGWGEKGKPGSGRFAYMDTHSIGGIDVELLWSFRN
jgi:hypothetical protein